MDQQLFEDCTIERVKIVINDREMVSIGGQLQGGLGSCKAVSFRVPQYVFNSNATMNPIAYIYVGLASGGQLEIPREDSSTVLLYCDDLNDVVARCPTAFGETECYVDLIVYK